MGCITGYCLFEEDTVIFNCNLHNPTQHPDHCHHICQADLQQLWYHYLPQALTYSKPQGTSRHVLRPLSVDYGCEIKQVSLCWRLIQRQWMSLRGKCEVRLPMWGRETYQEYRDSCMPYMTSVDKLPAFWPTKEEGLWHFPVQWYCIVEFSMEFLVGRGRVRAWK